ncbi:phosphoglycerate kinase [Mycoplasma capricolum]|uniref:phosphoglycerate kinase n=1 Tax=Mycoplasma capricolum TaxID=2095 RepID=UPI003DA5E65A
MSIFKKTDTIVWNVAAGIFEFKNFDTGTNSIYQAIVKQSKNIDFTLINGEYSIFAVINVKYFMNIGLGKSFILIYKIKIL